MCQVSKKESFLIGSDRPNQEKNNKLCPKVLTLAVMVKMEETGLLASLHHLFTLKSVVSVATKRSNFISNQETVRMLNMAQMH